MQSQTKKRKQWKTSEARKEYEKIRRIRTILYLCFAIVVLVASFVSRSLLPTQIEDLPSNSLRVSFLDVGQGDSILLQTADAVALVDGGDMDHAYALLHTLQGMGIQKIDYLINSHPHSDHLGGLATIVRNMEIGRVFMPAFPEELTPIGSSFTNFLNAIEERERFIETPACGDVISLGCATLEFRTIDNSDATDLNDCSLLCLVQEGTQSFLLCGDITKSAENTYLDAGLLQPVTVLKCPHHGSNSSSSAKFLAATLPAYVAISVGAENAYGHPGKYCLERLFAQTKEVYRTDMDGTIVFQTDGDTMRVQTQTNHSDEVKS